MYRSRFTSLFFVRSLFFFFCFFWLFVLLLELEEIEMRLITFVQFKCVSGRLLADNMWKKVGCLDEYLLLLCARVCVCGCGYNNTHHLRLAHCVYRAHTAFHWLQIFQLKINAPLKLSVYKNVIRIKCIIVYAFGVYFCVSTYTEAKMYI